MHEGGPTEPIPVLRPLVVTESHRPVAHYVTDHEAHGEIPQALCGRTFRPACLAAPLGAMCPDCAAAHAAVRQRRRASRRRVLARLLRSRRRR